MATSFVEAALTDDDLQPVIDDYNAVVDEVALKLHRQNLISDLFADEQSNGLGIHSSV